MTFLAMITQTTVLEITVFDSATNVLLLEVLSFWRGESHVNHANIYSLILKKCQIRKLQ